MNAFKNIFAKQRLQILHKSFATFSTSIGEKFGKFPEAPKGFGQTANIFPEAWTRVGQFSQKYPEAEASFREFSRQVPEACSVFGIFYSRFELIST